MNCGHRVRSRNSGHGAATSKTRDHASLSHIRGDCRFSDGGFSIECLHGFGSGKTKKCSARSKKGTMTFHSRSGSCYGFFSHNAIQRSGDRANQYFNSQTRLLSGGLSPLYRQVRSCSMSRGSNAGISFLGYRKLKSGRFRSAQKTTLLSESRNNGRLSRRVAGIGQLTSN